MKFHKLWLFLPGTILILVIVFAALGSFADGENPQGNQSKAVREEYPVLKAEFEEYPEELNYYDNKLMSPDDPEWYLAARVIRLEEGDTLKLLETDIRKKEVFLQGKGTYLALSSGEQHVYLRSKDHPDYIVYLVAGTSVEPEELQELSGHVQLIISDDLSQEPNITWGEFEIYMESIGYGVQDPVPLAFSRESLGGICMPGEKFSVQLMDRQGECSVDLVVKEIQWLDQVSDLFQSEDYERLSDGVSPSGDLLTDTVRFILTEDGTTNADVVTSAEDRSQKFLYLSVTFQNNSGRKLYGPQVNGKVILLEEDREELQNYDMETPQKGDEWTYVTHSSRAAGERTLCWWKSEKGKDIISLEDLILEDGEEITMQLGILVDSVYLPYAFVSLDTIPLNPDRYTEEEYLAGKYLLDVRELG